MDEELKERSTGSDLKDVVIIFSIIIIVLVAFAMLDIFERLRVMAANPEGFRIVEFLFVLMLFGFAFAIFARLRWKDVGRKYYAGKHEIEELIDNTNRLRTTVNLSPDCISVVTREGKIIFINQAGINLFGATEEDQIIGKEVWDFLHYSYKNLVAKRFEDMCKYNKKVPQIDVTIKKLDGLYIDVNVASTPIMYHSIPHVVTIMRDVSERKKNESIKAELASIVTSSNDAIYAMGLDGAIRSWNPGAEKLYDYSEKEAVGENIEIVVPKDKSPELKNLLNKVFKGERIESFETKRQKKDGTILDVSLTISPLRDESGTVYGASAISRDITFKKMVEEELRHYSEELALSNEELYVFSYAASHDLQEPLRNIQAFIEALRTKHKKFTKDLNEKITEADEGVVRMHRLITDFLIYSRIGTEKALTEKVDCNLILKDALSNLNTAITESKAKVKSYELPTIMANPLHITQVFQNLIGNALKYQGEQPPVIEVSVEKKDNFWNFRVKDNGIGIEEWFSERIFIVFQKLHDPKKYPGSGIGLALCKRVVEKHGGKIWFESQVGKGTTFYFSLPVLKELKKKTS